MSKNSSRPILSKNITLDFNEYYWLKQELMGFCREMKISTSGGKREIVDRIHHFLATGKVKTHNITNNTLSKFDWRNENLSRKVIIKDNYTNTRNVRNFFLQEIGSHFSFNVMFLKWLKENVGKTLGEAIIEWGKIELLKKSKEFKTEIAPQFEYNLYMRDFMEANPHLQIEDARKFWNLKRQQKGTMKYNKNDLNLT